MRRGRWVVGVVVALLAPLLWTSSASSQTAGEAGQTRWSRRFGGTGYETITSVAADVFGGAFIGGTFTNTTDFGSGPVQPGSPDSEDGFLVHAAAYTGETVWSRTLGATIRGAIGRVAVDPSGDVIAVGGFEGTVDFGGTSLTTQTGMQTFAAKYDGATGDLEWVRSIDTGQGEGFVDIAMTSSGDLYLVGIEGGVPRLSRIDGTSGELLTDRVYSDLGTATFTGITVDAEGLPIIVGSFTGEATFGDAHYVAPTTLVDGFVLAVDAAGEPRWSRHITGDGRQSPSAVATSDGTSVIVLGWLTGSADFGDGSVEVPYGGQAEFLASYRAVDGAYRWSTQAGPGIDGRLAVTPQGDAVVMGHGVYPDAQHITVGQFAGADGAPQWSRTFTGEGDQRLGALASTPDAVVVAGSFNGTIDMGLGALTSAGSDDAFVGVLESGPDTAAPQTSFTTPNGTRVTRVPTPDQWIVDRAVRSTVDGYSLDARSAIRDVEVRFLNVDTGIETYVHPALSCTTATCTGASWSVTPPLVPGRYYAWARAVDGAANVESPAPRVTITVV